MSTWSLSESSSGCSRAGAARAACLPAGLRDSNTFSFTTQPIVYYAEVSEIFCEKQKCHDKNIKPNHFVKAFHWYMQEHGTGKNTVAATHDIGFASWLDHKYQEYLRGKPKDASLEYVVSHVAVPTVVQDVVLRKSTKPKGLRRVLRSPWRKRHADANATTVAEGTGGTECKGSWETILKPKSLSRFESESSAQKRSVTCDASSKLTVTSSDTQAITKSNQRDLEVEKITMQRDVILNVDKNISDKDTNKNVDELHSKNKLEGQNHTKAKYEVKCECPVEEMTIATNDRTTTSTQCGANMNEDEKSIKKVAYTNVPSKSTISTESQVTPNTTKNAYAGSSSDLLRKNNTNSKGDVKPECPTETKTTNVQRDRNEVVEESKTISTTQVPAKQDITTKSTGPVNDTCEDLQKPLDDCPHAMFSADEAAQTSDYAIIPAHVMRGQPLLMQIMPTK